MSFPVVPGRILPTRLDATDAELRLSKATAFQLLKAKGCLVIFWGSALGMSSHSSRGHGGISASLFSQGAMAHGLKTSALEVSLQETVLSNSAMCNAALRTRCEETVIHPLLCGFADRLEILLPQLSTQLPKVLSSHHFTWNSGK
jgi:hypothetical protein